MAQCPKCGAARQTGAAECPQCGIIYARFEKKQAQQQAEQEAARAALLVNCPVCNKQISRFAPTCPECGQPIAGTAPPAAATGESPQPEQELSQVAKKYPVAIGCGGLLLLCFILSLFSGGGGTGGDQNEQKCFSSWDGSHRELTALIKKTMNDPKSYEHVGTKYWDNDDHLIVLTQFRGKNAFGGIVINSVKAKTNKETCQVIEIID